MIVGMSIYLITNWNREVSSAITGLAATTNGFEESKAL
jgi:hypothetical protein